MNVVTTASFSPDGKTVLTASLDGTARLWDVAGGPTPRQVFRHRSPVRVACFSPDGKTVLTASEDGTARRWDAGTGKPIGLALWHQASVSNAAFSPDGKTIITKANDKNPARLWDISLLPDDLPRIATWVEVLTGLELDEQGDRPGARQRGLVLPSRAAESNGRSAARSGPSRCSTPSFRDSTRPLVACALMDLARWDDAEAAFTEAIRVSAVQRLGPGRARPLPRRPCSSRKGRGRLRASLHPE